MNAEGEIVIVSETERDDETGERLYWSNVLGWCSLADATRFDEYELDDLRLPIGGIWVRRPSEEPTATTS